MINFSKKLKLFCCALFFITSPAFANNVIDILVVYTKGVEDIYGEDTETRINHIFQFTNQIYRDSRVDLEIRLVGTLMVDYTDDNDGVTALKAITFGDHAALQSVAQKRAETNADMVIFYRPFKNIHGSCGQAWVGISEGDGVISSSRDYMYSHIPINSCGDFSTAHELGHNMGLRHSRERDGAGGVFDYALGYGIKNQFATIMAYQTDYNVDYWEGKVYKFSNPALTCKGVPCGISHEDTVNGADSHRALSVTIPQIANFYQPQNPAQSSSSSQSNSSSSSSHSNTPGSGNMPGNNTPRPSAPEKAESSGGGGSMDLILLCGLLLLFWCQCRYLQSIRARQ